MSEPPTPPDDERLLARIRAALARQDAVPPSVLEAALAAYESGRPDAELADLVADSAQTPPVGVRDAGLVGEGPRYLEFHTDRCGIRMEITAHDASLDIVGAVTTADVTTVRIRWPNGSHTRKVDPAGGFTAVGIPHGPVSVLCHGEHTPPVVTSWVRVP